MRTRCMCYSYLSIQIKFTLDKYNFPVHKQSSAHTYISKRGFGKIKLRHKYRALLIGSQAMNLDIEENFRARCIEGFNYLALK